MLTVDWRKCVILYIFIVLVIYNYFLSYISYPSEQNTGAKFITVEEAWPEGSNFNLSTYTNVVPQFLTLPSRKSDQTTTLILVTSSPKNREARFQIRNTWAEANITKKYNIEVNFVLGVDKEEKYDVSDEIEVFSDILIVNVIDSYMNLTLKSVFILKYLSDINGLSKNLKTVMKTDDDCYVNIQALAHLIKNNSIGKSFLGHALDSGGEKHIPVDRSDKKWSIPYWMYKAEHFPMAVSGSGYLFPISSAPCLFKVANRVSFIVLEDVYVTGFLGKLCQMTIKSSIHFKYMGIQNYCDVDPYKDIVIHRVDIELMHKRIMGVPIESSFDMIKEQMCLEHL